MTTAKNMKHEMDTTKSKTLNLLQEIAKLKRNAKEEYNQKSNKK